VANGAGNFLGGSVITDAHQSVGDAGIHHIVPLHG